MSAPGGVPCLFSDMRPLKILSIITAAREAGVRHIIEEGRFGGLSALIYSHHGFVPRAATRTRMHAPSIPDRARTVHAAPRLDGQLSHRLQSLCAQDVTSVEFLPLHSVVRRELAASASA